jgi:hypothetical protein
MKRGLKRHHYISKSSRNEILAAKVALIIALLVAILIGISLGTRAPVSTLSTLHRNYEKLTRLARGWELDAGRQSVKLTTDLRMHAGFHFEWPARLNPPQLNGERLPSPERGQAIDALLKLGRSRAELHATPRNPHKFLLKEKLDTAGNVTIHKNVHLLLPGETTNIRFESMASSARQWKLRLRAVAVTQDRLDSPLTALVGFPHEESTPISVDPKGQHADLEIPAATEFARRGEKSFTVEWPKSASGILVLEGFQPGAINTEIRTQSAKNLVIYIDSMNAPLTRLAKTIATINKLSGREKHSLYFSHLIPSADSYHLSRDSILTSRSPVDLGATLKNQKLRDYLSPQPTAINKILSKGGSARRINLGQNEKCDEKCKEQSISGALNSVFTSELKILRREEFASSKVYLQQSEFLTDPGLLFVQVEFPQESLRLNWETVSNSSASTFSWIGAGLLSPLATKNPSLKSEEKIAQLDLWLAALAESFLATSNQSNIALVLHNNGSPVVLSTDSQPHSYLTRGEAMVYLHEGLSSEERKNDSIDVITPTSLQEVIRFFDKRTHDFPAEEAEDNMHAAFQRNDALISQLQDSTYSILTSEGWLIDPKHSINKNNIKHTLRTEPEKTQIVQERTNAERKKSRLFGLHLTFPGNNSRDEIIETELSTSLKGIGCESQTENAQLKTLTLTDGSAGTETMMQLIGRRPTQAQWHIFCLFEGKISSSTFLRLRFKLNGQPVERERLGLSEFALPIRGFLWRSPDTIELVGAQIFDATVALGSPDSDAAKQTSVVLWSEKLPNGIDDPRATFVLEPTAPALPSPAASPEDDTDERLSEKE